MTRKGYAGDSGSVDETYPLLSRPSAALPSLFSLKRASWLMVMTTEKGDPNKNDSGPLLHLTFGSSETLGLFVHYHRIHIFIASYRSGFFAFKPRF